MAGRAMGRRDRSTDPVAVIVSTDPVALTATTGSETMGKEISTAGKMRFIGCLLAFMTFSVS